MDTDLIAKVKRDYRAIAHEFSETRHAPWPEFKEFEKLIFKKAKSPRTFCLLDTGCGNGRLVDFLKPHLAKKQLQYTGIDNNIKLLRLARKLHPKKNWPGIQFKKADMLKLPFPGATFNTVWCIAALHHLPKKFHSRALKELKRVLTPEGSFVLTVWDLWQPKYQKFIDKKTRHALIPWGKDKKVKRFYYAFKKFELKQLLKKAGFSKLTQISSEHNFAFVWRKAK